MVSENEAPSIREESRSCLMMTSSSLSLLIEVLNFIEHSVPVSPVPEFDDDSRPPEHLLPAMPVFYPPPCQSLPLSMSIGP